MAEDNKNMNKTKAYRNFLVENQKELGILRQEEIDTLSKKLEQEGNIKLKLEEIRDVLDDINSKNIKSVELAEREKAQEEAQFKIIQKKFGLTEKELNQYKKADKWQKKSKKNIEEIYNKINAMKNFDLKKFLDPRAAIKSFSAVPDKLISGFMGVGKSLLKMKGQMKGFIASGSKGAKVMTLFGKAGALGIKGIGLALKSTGIGLIIAGIAAAVQALQTAFKYNIGGIASIFGETMAKLKNMWSVFEVSIAKTLKEIGPLFKNVFGGIADIVTTLFSGILKVWKSFMDGFISGLGDVKGSAGGLKSAFDTIAPAIKDIADALAPVMNLVGKIVGFLFKMLIPAVKIAAKIIGAIAKTVGKIIGWIPGVKDEAKDVIEEEGKAAQKQPVSNAGSSQSTQNNNDNRQTTIQMTVDSKQTGDHMIRKQKELMPDLVEASHTGAI